MAIPRLTTIFSKFIIFTILVYFTSAIHLPNQPTDRPHKLRQSSTTVAPASGAVTQSTETKDGVATYRFINSNTGTTCILMRTDAVVEVKFRLHNLEEQADSFIPDKALVEGNCKNEDNSFMRLSWTGYSLVISFSKNHFNISRVPTSLRYKNLIKLSQSVPTDNIEVNEVYESTFHVSFHRKIINWWEKSPGGELWYIDKVDLTVSPDLPQLKGVKIHGNAIKLYHKTMLIPTPVGKSYACEELDIDLETDKEDRPPPGLRGSLLLRALQLQPFMYKSEQFEPSMECKEMKTYRDETAPLAVGTTLAIFVLMTISGYAIFRYFKVKNVQYNTME